MQTYTLFDEDKKQRLARARKRSNSHFKPAPIDHTGTFLRIRATLQKFLGELDHESIKIAEANKSGYDFHITGFEYAGFCTVENGEDGEVLNLYPDAEHLTPLNLNLENKCLCRHSVNFSNGINMGGGLNTWHWAFTESEARRWANKKRVDDQIECKQIFVGVAPLPWQIYGHRSRSKKPACKALAIIFSNP